MNAPTPTHENAQRTANALEYPCGCTATPAESVPTYCPDHGTQINLTDPYLSSAYETQQISATPEAWGNLQAMADRISGLETAIRGVVDCTEEPDGACRCIQIAQSILGKK